MELIQAKREWHWKPSMDDLKRGFRGWHQRGYLPHFDAPNVTQMVTFLLHDSFPAARRPEWEPILKEPDCSKRRQQLEKWLDRGCGDCWLLRNDVAAIVEESLRREDGADYQLRAWVLMPNHVHLIVDVLDVPLSKLLERWKGRAARSANVVLRRNGSFWQRDYYDTLIRDEDRLSRAIRYVEDNPVKAGLATMAEDWQWASARRRDEYERLPCER